MCFWSFTCQSTTWWGCCFLNPQGCNTAHSPERERRRAPACPRCTGAWCCCCGSRTQTLDPLRRLLCNTPAKHGEKTSRQSNQTNFHYFTLQHAIRKHRLNEVTESRATHSDGVAGVKLGCSHGLAVVGDPQLYWLWLLAPEQRLYEHTQPHNSAAQPSWCTNPYQQKKKHNIEVLYTVCTHTYSQTNTHTRDVFIYIRITD